MGGALVSFCIYLDEPMLESKSRPFVPSAARTRKQNTLSVCTVAVTPLLFIIINIINIIIITKMYFLLFVLNVILAANLSSAMFVLSDEDIDDWLPGPLVQPSKECDQSYNPHDVSSNIDFPLLKT